MSAKLCSKPGCGAIARIGYPCTDWDCPQDVVSANEHRTLADALSESKEILATEIEGSRKAYALYLAAQEEIERLTRERDNLWMAYLHAQMCFHGGVRSSNPDQMAHNDVDRALAGNGPKNGAALATAKRAGRIGGAA